MAKSRVRAPHPSAPRSRLQRVQLCVLTCEAPQAAPAPPASTCCPTSVRAAFASQEPSEDVCGLWSHRRLPPEML